MELEEIIENGRTTIGGEPLPPLEIHPEQRLGAGALRRLTRLQARVDGATEVAQAAINTHVQVRQAYQQAFEGACEDAGIHIPPGEQDVDIDWTTGQVRFRPRG